MPLLLLQPPTQAQAWGSRLPHVDSLALPQTRQSKPTTKPSCCGFKLQHVDSLALPILQDYKAETNRRRRQELFNNIITKLREAISALPTRKSRPEAMFYSKRRGLKTTPDDEVHLLDDKFDQITPAWEGTCEGLEESRRWQWSHLYYSDLVSAGMESAEGVRFDTVPYV